MPRPTRRGCGRARACIGPPPATALDLAAALRSADVEVTLVEAGDHRLSRPGDIALLLRNLEALAAAEAGLP